MFLSSHPTPPPLSLSTSGNHRGKDGTEPVHFRPTQNQKDMLKCKFDGLIY